MADVRTEWPKRLYLSVERSTTKWRLVCRLGYFGSVHCSDDMLKQVRRRQKMNDRFSQLRAAAGCASMNKMDILCAAIQKIAELSRGAASSLIKADSSSPSSFQNKLHAGFHMATPAIDAAPSAFPFRPATLPLPLGLPVSAHMPVPTAWTHPNTSSVSSLDAFPRASAVPAPPLTDSAVTSSSAASALFAGGPSLPMSLDPAMLAHPAVYQNLMAVLAMNLLQGSAAGGARLPFQFPASNTALAAPLAFPAAGTGALAGGQSLAQMLSANSAAAVLSSMNGSAPAGSVGGSSGTGSMLAAQTPRPPAMDPFVPLMAPRSLTPAGSAVNGALFPSGSPINLPFAGLNDGIASGGSTGMPPATPMDLDSLQPTVSAAPASCCAPKGTASSGTDASVSSVASPVSTTNTGGCCGSATSANPTAGALTIKGSCCGGGAGDSTSVLKCSMVSGDGKCDPDRCLCLVCGCNEPDMLHVPCGSIGACPVSYTHLTLPTNREV